MYSDLKSHVEYITIKLNVLSKIKELRDLFEQIKVPKVTKMTKFHDLTPYCECYI